MSATQSQAGQMQAGAEILLRALKDQGVEVVFGYPGGAVLPIYDALFNQNAIRHILVRHEQAAVHAAEGYARSTGKVGCVLVTSGPGATNAVTGLVDALMDSIPIVEHLDRMTPEFATAWYHWFFFAQPDIPERVIGADPDAWYGGDPAVMGEENFAERRAAVHRPEVVRAMLEDYRAGLTVDRADEEADRAAGRRLTQPVLALWSSRDDLEELFGDPLAIWPAWADDVTGHPIDSGHHMAEEAPAALTAALADFFRAR